MPENIIAAYGLLYMYRFKVKKILNHLKKDNAVIKIGKVNYEKITQKSNEKNILYLFSKEEKNVEWDRINLFTLQKSQE
ncbi:hypothetical protein PWEIH_10593 [Listeria weihenstephanensis FSL R9-0317]|nr:hypothetical protein PWEIH_10593 [Listeria weihenstephanensis FSL R9-0317]